MDAFALLTSRTQAYSALLRIWQDVRVALDAGQRLELVVRPEKRSGEQNARMWAMLSELASQVEWHGQKLSKEEWKDVMTSALKRQKVVPGIDGGFVVLGYSTSRMSKGDMSELMELVAAFGAQHNVEFADAIAQ